MTEFPVGDFYDCRGSERLTHESPEDAIEEWIDLWLSPGCDTSAMIREHSPVKLSVFRRMSQDETWIERRARNALACLAEEFSEEYGDPDGYLDDGLGLEAQKECLPAVVQAFRAFLAHGTSWGCEVVATVVLDAAEVEAMMREHNPGWWDTDEAGVTEPTTAGDDHGSF